MSLEVSIQPSDDVALVTVSGRLDAASAPALEEKLSAAIPSSGKMVIDMSGLDYVSSAGLRILLKAAKLAKASSVKLALSGLQPNVREVFDISGFSTIFLIHDDVAASKAALA